MSILTSVTSAIACKINTFINLNLRIENTIFEHILRLGLFSEKVESGTQKDCNNSSYLTDAIIMPMMLNIIKDLPPYLFLRDLVGENFRRGQNFNGSLILEDVTL